MRISVRALALSVCLAHCCFHANSQLQPRGNSKSRPLTATVLRFKACRHRDYMASHVGSRAPIAVGTVKEQSRDRSLCLHQPVHGHIDDRGQGKVVYRDGVGAAPDVGPDWSQLVEPTTHSQTCRDILQQPDNHRRDRVGLPAEEQFPGEPGSEHVVSRGLNLKGLSGPGAAPGGSRGVCNAA